MKEYRNNYWFEFREKVFSALGYFCSKCERTDDEVTLQVHHKIYISGRKPWEYNFSDCEILCKGCHAREHGLIRPNEDWILSHSHDLQQQTGTCELCGSSLRYEYHLFHNDWSEELIVGSFCCDKLTGNIEASEHMESENRKQKAFDAFLQSPKWQQLSTQECYYKKNRYFSYYINESNQNFYITINQKNGGNKPFSSKLEAQKALFDFIKTNQIKKFFDDKGNKLS